MRKVIYLSLFLGFINPLWAQPNKPNVWLSAQALSEDEAKIAFSISGADRGDPIGARISFGERQFEIIRVSLHQVVGAARVQPPQHSTNSEFAVFSSSYSEQTATGKPWVAAETTNGCDKQYNSFLAIYRLNSPERVTALGEIPFRQLTNNIEHSDHSAVFCFFAAPPERSKRAH